MREFVCLALVAALAACSPPPAEQAETTTLTTVSIPAQPGAASVDGVMAGARLTSPATLTGIAPKDWYFEAQFPVMLVGADGRVIAEGPARAQSDWTAPNNDPIRFQSELTFSVAHDTPATLVLQEDMPGEDAPARETRIPVVLSAHS
ncbi:Gmad2 immunoglobulin-like domain-containing protein [Terricaulis sp.]|uniref:Gmad2 immunoglobulin-like domain-containing protein n=1 Tax=Terricaulis sp. TaxID=2768686 RepID=UPI00378316DA